MSGDPHDRREVTFRFDAPRDLGAGTYANTLSVTYSPYDFQLDFAVTEKPELDDPDDAAASVTIPCTITSRVRIPAALVFDAIRTMNAAMTTYEGEFGEIRRPGSRG